MTRRLRQPLERAEPPNYGTTYSKRASRKSFASYREYVKYIKDVKETREVRRELLQPSQLIPILIQRAFRRCYLDDATLNSEHLLLAVQRHDGFIQRENVPSDQLVEGVRRAAKRKSSEAQCSIGRSLYAIRLKIIFSTTLMRRLGSNLRTGGIFPVLPSWCPSPS